MKSLKATYWTMKKVPCLGCGKKYKHIYPHIKGNGKCQEKYDVDEEKKKYNSIRAEIVRISKARAKNTYQLLQKEGTLQSISRSGKKRS